RLQDVDEQGLCPHLEQVGLPGEVAHGVEPVVDRARRAEDVLPVDRRDERAAQGLHEAGTVPVALALDLPHPAARLGAGQVAPDGGERDPDGVLGGADVRLERGDDGALVPPREVPRRPAQRRHTRDATAPATAPRAYAAGRVVTHASTSFPVLRHLTLPSPRAAPLPMRARSEEHTSELQSREKLVCRLLLEKKN